METITRDMSAPTRRRSPLPAAASGGLRVCLFTDTLGDVNGVSRFIRGVADRAHACGRDLRVVTSTNFEVPSGANIFNFKPLLACAMPGYKNLELAVPPRARMLRHVGLHRPDVIHVSTPGPVGLVGCTAARRLGIPLLGVYHTDFPAYVERLFDDAAMTWAARWYMRRFYRRFRAVLARSGGYAGALDWLGSGRVVALRPGVDTDVFHPRHRDAGLWGRLGGAGERVRAGSVKVLSIGRVSVEKNLPLLTRAWRAVIARTRGAGVDAQLIVVGDGPYRAEMERELADHPACFLGFRHGAELSAIYAMGDVFVFPSTTDTLGQVVLEAQASGVPVLVTDQGGPKEVVEDGVTGLVLRASPDHWVEAITRLILDSDRRVHMGRAAHALMQQFSFDASFDQFWAEHERVVRRAHLSGGR
ncbi:MAG: glycosyltransferase family 1 protein [Phycisphaerales bacterium]|nr:glycosyltransferase family 1 protein [Phycisphaerales bacterium]